MYHPSYRRHSSTTGIILAASNISGRTVLGDLPESVVNIIAFNERVTKVQATNVVMFHLATRKGDHLRRDTSTYQWFGKSARAIVKNPYALLPGKSHHTFQLIGRVELPSSRYPEIRYLRLVVKYVPGNKSSSGIPEIWLQTMVAHNQSTIEPYLRKAVILAPNHRGQPTAVKRGG